MSGAGLAFVSVVFEAEMPLLELQARSFAVHVPPELARRLVLLDNTRRGIDAATRQRLRAGYGPHADRLEILRPADVARVPVAVGWRTQQVLKLAVARQLDEPYYVALDAKNHFVADPGMGWFVAPDGRPRVDFESFLDHPLRGSLERVLRYAGLDPAEHLGRFTSTVTPFVFDTGLVRTVLDGVEERSGRPFAEEFVRQDLTEFFLYAAWLVAGGRPLDDLFDLNQRPATIVWPRRADPAGVRRAVTNVRDRGAPVFTVHRRAFAALDAESAEEIAALWADRGLFPTVTEGTRFVAAFAASSQAADRRQRRREIPARGRTALRRLWRGLAARRAASEPAEPDPSRPAR
jgi:hypothetical protein